MRTLLLAVASTALVAAIALFPSALAQRAPVQATERPTDAAASIPVAAASVQKAAQQARTEQPSRVAQQASSERGGGWQQARPLAGVSVKGLSRVQADNVRAQVGLFLLDDAARARLSSGRLALLLRRAPDEVRRALEPFGYYTSSVDVQVEDVAAGARVLLQVERGPPVRVRSADIQIDGEGKVDELVAEALAAPALLPGAIMNHARYEILKASITRSLAARGFFDASLVEHTVEVLRADSRADIRLRWDSGPRYRLGEITVSGSQLEPGLVERWVDLKPGEPFEQDRLLRLHQRLTDLDYFGFIDIRPEPQPEDHIAPVAIDVVPAKRNVYTAGVSFGTDSGVGLKFGLDRRWVNARGHKFATELDLAQRRNTLSAVYRIPAFAPVEGWYQFGASYREDQSDTVDSELAELVASRSGRLGDWTLTTAMQARRERFAIGIARTEGSFGLSTVVYPSFRARYHRYDDPLYSRRGLTFSTELRAGAQAIGSDVDFAQLLVEARWVRAFGQRNRVLLRGQLAHTESDNFFGLPSSLRFFAGGDRSVRGYGYQEISPVNDAGDPIGGSSLLVANVEYERMFTDSWGAAVFVDAGSAFNDRSAGVRKGVGLGLRWRSPVGPVSIDIARGLDDPRDGLQLHLTLGPEL